MLQFSNWRDAPQTEWLSMVGSEAIGLPLVKAGDFAADMLQFRPGQATCLHTHPGSHILFVVQGDGWVEYGGEMFDLALDTCYLVPGETPHRVRAASIGMTLLSVSSQHQPVNSPYRLEILEP